MYCSKCGNQIENTTKFCPVCGKENVKVQKIVQENNKPNNKRKGRKTDKLLIGLVVIVIAVIGGIFGREYYMNMPGNRILGTWYELEDYETINYSVEVTFLEDGVVSSDDEIGTYYLTDDEVIVLFDDIKRSLYFYDPEYSLDKMMIDEYKDVLAMDYDGKTYLYVKEKIVISDSAFIV